MRSAEQGTGTRTTGETGIIEGDRGHGLGESRGETGFSIEGVWELGGEFLEGPWRWNAESRVKQEEGHAVKSVEWGERFDEFSASSADGGVRLQEEIHVATERSGESIEPVEAQGASESLVEKQESVGGVRASCTDPSGKGEALFEMERDALFDPRFG